MITPVETAVFIRIPLRQVRGPDGGDRTVDPMEFRARPLVHIPDQGHVTTRYYGWCANRPRGGAAAGGARRHDPYVGARTVGDRAVCWTDPD